MKILKWLNKKEGARIIFSLLITAAPFAEDKPGEIWDIEKKEVDTIAEEKEEEKIDIAETAFVGDDLNDLAVRPVVGLLIAPADACTPVRQGAHAVLRKRGGHGAVRELAETILQARGHWQRLKRDGWRDRND